MKNQTTSIHLHTPSSPRNVGEPPEVVPPEANCTEENIKIMLDLLKNPKLDNLMILNVVLQVQDEAGQ